MKKLFLIMEMFLTFNIFAFGDRKLQTIEAIPKIHKKTEYDVKQVRVLSDNYVIKNIKQSNKYLDEAKKKIERAESKDKKKAIRIFIDEYKQIVDFYREITKDSEVKKIKKELFGYYDEVKKFSNNLEIMEKAIADKKNQLNYNLNYYPSNLTREDEVKKNSIEQQIKYLEQQEKMISDYNVLYSKLMPEFEKVQSDVNYFILVLKETAIVYETAYKTAELSLNISNALDNIQAINSLNDLSKEILNSWKNLDAIMTELNKNMLSFES